MVSKLLYPIWKKMAFFHGRLREFMIECTGTRYPVRCVPDSWLCPRGQRRTIKNNKLASLFWKTKYFTCLFRDIYLSWFFKRANLFDISFYWIYEWRHLSIYLSGFLLILPFPRLLHKESCWKSVTSGLAKNDEYVSFGLGRNWKE